jgi:hypothetical protein
MKEFMDLTVTAMVLLTALLHAGWNAVYKGRGSGLATGVVITIGMGGTSALLLPFFPIPDPASWLLCRLQLRSIFFTGYFLPPVIATATLATICVLIALPTHRYYSAPRPLKVKSGRFCPMPSMSAFECIADMNYADNLGIFS